MFDWLKDRAALVAELREAREQGVTAAHFTELDVDRLTRQRDQLAQELTDTRQKLHSITQQRDDAWAELEAAEGGSDVVRDHIKDYRPRTAKQDLLQARARADQLAERLTLLQEANMRAGCAHGVPLVETGSRA